MNTGQKNIYITTTLPYVNADPHVGFAMEIIRADALARYYRALGKSMFFNTGTDEHGAKIHEAAQKEGTDTQAYTDKFAARFRELAPLLNLSVDNFIRTTDPHHVRAAQEFWKRCDKAGDIYKKLYKVKYCIGCELEKTDSELVDGKCPVHPNRELEIREEENYFFKFSKYTQPLLDFYAANPNFVVPDFRFNETRAFVGRGLEDFSISRLRSKMSWGVPVPGDDEHVMYVWFDALVNYISAIGWPACPPGVASKPDHRCGEDSPELCMFTKWWPVIQYCGKDNNRQQAAMWQAMLMSAGIPNSTQIVIDGFITSGGTKMSKSLGNVISPYEVIEKFKGVTDFPEDVLRFVLLHDIPSFEDGDLTMASIEASYAANLQNGLGNLTSRIMKMATTHDVRLPDEAKLHANTHLDGYMENRDMMGAMHWIWGKISDLDKFIQMNEPYKKVKTDPDGGKKDIATLLSGLERIAVSLTPFLPHTSTEISRLIHDHQMPGKPLFARVP